MRRPLTWVFVLCNLVALALPSPLSGRGWTPANGGGTGEEKCPLADLPAPPNRPADFVLLLRLLNELSVPIRDGELYEIFHSDPPKTKMEQFYRLLYYIQERKREELPVVVRKPAITEILLAARVFTEPDFPDHIVEVRLEKSDTGNGPRYSVHFDRPEARFPLNGGQGFAVWEHGKCQWARDLILHDGFSFHLREKGKNLIVEDFNGVQSYGDFGARKGPIKIDLNYVDFEKVEFIHGTDRGRVKSRVAQREFKTNPHSFWFKFVGRLIPDTSEHRIDW